MVRIPRTEPSVRLAMANQPNMSSDALTAPGRALQGLGSAIAGFGEAIDQEQTKEQDFADNMLMLKTDNEMGLNQIEAQNTYSGTGDDYLPQRTEYYSTTTSNAISQMQPRNQRKAAVFFEQRRGPYLERDAKFGGQRRQDTLIGGINDTVGTEYGKLATVPPEEFEQRFNETVRGVDLIIQSAPLPDSKKEEVARSAAEQAYGILKGLAEDPDTAPEIVPRILKMIETPPEEIQGGALEEVPDQTEQGAQGVQGLPGSPSGPALPKPQKLGAAGVEPPQSPGSTVQPAALKDFSANRTHFRPLRAENVKNIVLHDVSGNPKTRRLPKGGSIPHYHITFDDKGVYQEIPFDRQAPHARAFNKDSIGIAYIGFEGDKLSPQAVANGALAVQMAQERFGIPAERILTHPGAGPSATKSGKDPREASWRGDVLAYLGQGGTQVALAGQQPQEPGAVNQRGLVQYAGLRSNLGGPEGEGARSPNTIPGEPKLVSGPTPVRVADASGRFVPQPQKPNYRSVDSQLRDLLIKNMGSFQKSMLRAEREKERLDKERIKEVQERTFDEGFDLWRKGDLTEAWIDENRPTLKSRDDQRLYQLLRNQSRNIDPKAYHELLSRIDSDPAGAVEQAREDLANGLISPSFYDRIETRARREMQPETKTPAWAKRWEGEVREQVGTHQGDSWDRIERSQGAMREFEDYISGEIDKGTLDYDKVSKRAKQTIDDYKKRRVQQKQSALTIPQKWSNATPETITLDEVAEAKARILAASNEEIQAAGSDPEARKRVLAKYKADYGQLDQWEKLLKERAEANGEKVPPPKPPMKLGGPKPEQGAVNQQMPQAQGVRGQPGTQSGSAANRPQAAQGESRPVGGALGVVPLAENPDGSVSLSVPGMILEPWRAFQRGLNREAMRGQYDEAGNPLYDPKAQSEDAMTAASVPLAATSFGTAVGAVPKGALGSGMVRAGEASSAKEISPQGFYSGLDEALKGFQPTDSVTSETLAKRGVKKSELEARGLSDLLSEGKSAKVSDLQKVAGENRVEVREAVRGRTPDMDVATSAAKERADAASRELEAEIARDPKSPRIVDLFERKQRAEIEHAETLSLGHEKWRRFTLDPSNPTYRETVLHLPNQAPDHEAKVQALRKELAQIEADGKVPGPGQYQGSEYQRVGDEMKRMMEARPHFQSGHWSEPNVIAHARTSIQKDAQGKDVFVVNELQSDWGQKLDDDMKNAYALDMFGAKGGTGWEQTGRRITAYDQLTKEQKAQISKAIDADRKTGALKGGVRDEAKIADLKKRVDGFGVSTRAQRAIFEAGDYAHARSAIERKVWPISVEQEVAGLSKEQFDAIHLAQAELHTAEASTPGHPLVNTTDQWVNTGLRRMIAQAVESGADQIAIPSGETVKAFGMGGQESGLKYAYDEMYPKNLKNILKKLDPSIESVKVDHLYGQKGQKLERSKGFTTFKITPKLREAIKKDGQPLFSGGVPVDGEDED